MSNKKIIQYGLMILAVIVILVGGSFESVQSYFGISGLTLLAAVFIWLGIDYYTLKKKYLGVLMIVAGLAVLYMMFEGFIAPLLDITM